MTIENNVILGKVALCFLGSCACILALKSPLCQRLGNRQFTRAALTLLVVSRLFIFTVLFLVLGMSPQSDAEIYFISAVNLLNGFMPVHDFPNVYGPLFPYIIVVPVVIWESPKSVILLSLLFEFGSLPLWMSVARQVVSESAARTATLLYVLCPFALVIIPLAGQNQVWLSFFLALTLWLMLRRRDGLAGTALALGVVAVKWLSLLHLPALWLGARNRLALTIPIIVLPAIVYTAAVFQIHHFTTPVDGTRPALGQAAAELLNANLQFHADDRSSGNLPFLLSITGLDIESAAAKQIFNFSALVILAAASLIPALRYRRLAPQSVLAMLTMLTLLLLIVSKKAFTSYLVMALFPMCIILATRTISTRGLLLFLSFLTIASIEPTLWMRWIDRDHPDFSVLWNQFRPQSTQLALLFVFLAVELLLLAGYAYYALQMWRHIVQTEARSTATTS